MENRICNGCGGVVGRDCFNPVECEWIGQQMDADDNYKRGYEAAQKDAYESWQRSEQEPPSFNQHYDTPMLTQQLQSSEIF